HRFDDAAEVLTRLAAVEPNEERAHLARFDVLQRGGRVAAAIELARTRYGLAGGSYSFESCELFALNFLDHISEQEMFERYRAFGERLERSIEPRFAHAVSRQAAGRRLRIGYVSGEFYVHPVSRFLVPLLERHDRSEFEIYCYSVGVFADSLTRLVEAKADRWREAKNLTDSQLADLVNHDQIDILVDLSGHAGVSRLGMFAQQPAPVQATWLGCPNTTGLTRIQYRITDHHCDPAGLTEAFHTEELARLPGSQWCYRPLSIASVAETAPIERNGAVTFGSFAQFPKQTPSMRTLWAHILRDTPNSRLLMAGIPE